MRERSGMNWSGLMLAAGLLWLAWWMLKALVRTGLLGGVILVAGFHWIYRKLDPGGRSAGGHDRIK